MMYRVGIAAAISIVAVVLWAAWFVESDTETVDDFVLAETETTVRDPLDSSIEAATERTISAENHEQPQEADDPEGLFGRVSLAEIENVVFQRMAEESSLMFTSIQSVDCGIRRCNVVFSSVDANPQYVGEHGDLLDTMMGPPWNDFQATSGNIGTREVSPGAREYVLGFTYVALVDVSADPEIAARQHAACAGAWARVTEQRGSDDYIRGAHERSAEWLEISASVLGLDEARRLANELRYGPLTRDCYAMPY